MEIAIIGNQSIKLKGKQVTFLVNPVKQMPKTPSDAVILLDIGSDIDVSRATNYRIIISGPGGYEVGGAKVSGTKTPLGTLYRLIIDDINIILGSATEVKAEGFNACQVIVVDTSNDFNEAFVTALEPKIAVLYGDKKAEAAKTLGAEGLSLVPKITITKDKLPEKMEVVILG